MKNSQKGFIIPLLIIIAAILVIGGGIYYSLKKSGVSLNLNIKTFFQKPTQLWKAEEKYQSGSFSKIAVDKDQNVYVIVNEKVEKINKEGTKVCEFNDVTLSPTDYNDITVGKTGVYFSAWVFDGASHYISTGSALVKIDNNCKKLWSTDPNETETSLTHLVVDSDDNVYGTTGNILYKFDSGGNKVWRKELGKGTSIDAPLVFDGNNKLYVFMGDEGVATIDKDDKEITKLSIPVANQGVVDDTGNIYVDIGNNTIAKYNANNGKIWSIKLQGSQLMFMRMDPQGNVYTARGLDGDCFVSCDYSIHKIDSNGKQIYSFSGMGASPNDMAIDSDGNFYITWGSANSDSTTLLKLH